MEVDVLDVMDVVPGVAYNPVDEQKARRILTLDVQLMRLGLVGSLKDDLMVERARLLKQLPPGFNLDKFARLERKNEGVPANGKGIFHNVKEVFHFGDDDGNSGWYWRTRPSVMRKRALELAIEHERWLPPERQKELREEREKREKRRCFNLV